MQVFLQRSFQTALADRIVHRVALFTLIRAAIVRTGPLLGEHRADCAEQMRSIGRVILAHSFALHIHTGILLVVLLDIGNQVHGHVFCQRKRCVIAKVDAPHAVIQADQCPRIRVGQAGRHTEVFLKVGAHRADKIGCRHDRRRVERGDLINCVALRIIFRTALICRAGRFLRLFDRLKAKRIRAFLDVGGQRGAVGITLCTDIGIGRRIGDRQAVAQRRALILRFRLLSILCAVIIGAFFRRRVIRTAGIRLDAVSQIKQDAEPIFLVLPERGIDQHKRKTCLVGHHWASVTVEDFTTRSRDS